jgi:hypothetical protein
LKFVTWTNAALVANSPTNILEKQFFGDRMQVGERILKAAFVPSVFCRVSCLGGMNARTTGQKWLRELAA